MSWKRSITSRRPNSCGCAPARRICWEASPNGAESDFCRIFCLPCKGRHRLDLLKPEIRGHPRVILEFAHDARRARAESKGNSGAQSGIIAIGSHELFGDRDEVSDLSAR